MSFKLLEVSKFAIVHRRLTISVCHPGNFFIIIIIFLKGWLVLVLLVVLV